MYFLPVRSSPISFCTNAKDREAGSASNTSTLSSSATPSMQGRISPALVWEFTDKWFGNNRARSTETFRVRPCKVGRLPLRLGGSYENRSRLGRRSM